MKRRFKYYLILILLIIAVASKFVLAPQVYILPDNFNYQLNLFSSDNLYNEASGRFAGEIFSRTKFELKGGGELDESVQLLKAGFEVRKPNEEIILSVNRDYAVDIFSRKHHSSFGDKCRSGYLFGPPQSTKENFTYWHINYDQPLEMVFLASESVYGKMLYKYRCEFNSDQTEMLTHLPGVPEERGVVLDAQLELWIDPLTGWLVKYHDEATAWFYDQKTGNRIHPWNRFRNMVEKSSVMRNIMLVNSLHFRISLFEVYLPVSCLVFALCFLLFTPLYLKSGHQYSPAFFAFIVLILGVLSIQKLTEYIRFIEEERDLIYSENSVIEVINGLKFELDKNFQALDYLRHYYELSDTLTHEGFVKISSSLIGRLTGIRALEWVPRVRDSQVQIYENYWRNNGFPQFKFKVLNPKIALNNPESYPVFYLYPMTANFKAFGLDLSSDSTRNEALKKAINTMDLTATSPLKLVQIDEPGILVFNPVRNKKNEFKGFIVGVYNLKDIVNSAIISKGFRNSMEMEITDLAGQNHQVIYSKDKFSSAKMNGVRLKNIISVADRNWQITIKIPDISNNTMHYILVSLSFIVLMLVVYLIFMVLSDNSKELRQMNETLKKSNISLIKASLELENKNKELKQFAYITSHDLQEPLHTLNGFVIRLKSKFEEQLPKGSLIYLNYIEQSAIRMKLLVADLLEYTRIGSVKEISNIQLSVLLGEIKDDLNAIILENNASVKVGEMPEIQGYSIEIRLLFQNLISNGIKFKAKDRSPEIFISFSETDYEWTFKVRDNGIGIKKEFQYKIFDIFQRLHSREEYPGTGIGLAFCKKIVLAHGGKIWVESELGRGSAFCFTLKKKLGS